MLLNVRVNRPQKLIIHFPNKRACKRGFVSFVAHFYSAVHRTCDLEKYYVCTLYIYTLYI